MSGINKCQALNLNNILEFKGGIHMKAAHIENIMRIPSTSA